MICMAYSISFYKAACHGSPDAVRKRPVSSLYILFHIFLKFSNTLDSKNVLL